MGHWTTIATMPAHEFAPVALGCADDVATLADTQCVSVLYSIPLFITLNVHMHKKTFAMLCQTLCYFSATAKTC